MPKIRYDGDAATAVKAAEDLRKSNERMESGVDDITNSFGKADKASQRFLNSVLTPTEKYNKKLANTNELVKKGVISQEEGVAVAARLRDQLERTGAAGQRTFGGRGLDAVQKFGGRLLSAAGSATVLATEIGKVEQRAQAAADNINAAIQGFGELAQISDNPKDLAANRKLVEQTISRGIFAPNERNQATQFGFALNSSEFVDKNLVLDIGEAKFVRSDSLAEFAGSVSTFRESVGVGEAGSSRDVVNKAIAAASPTRATAPELLNAAAAIGPQLSALEFSDEAGFGVLSIITRQTGSAAESKTRAKAFLGTLDSKGIGKATLVGSVESIQEQIDGGTKVQDILGDNKEAIEGFRFLRNKLPELRKEIARIDRSQALEPLAGKLTLLDSDPTLRASKLKFKKEGELDVLITELTARRETLLDSTVADIQKRNLQRFGVTRATLKNSLLDASSGVADGLQLEKPFLRNILTKDLTQGSQLISDDTRQELREYLGITSDSSERTAEAATRLSEAAERMTAAIEGAPVDYPRPSRRQEQENNPDR